MDDNPACVAQARALGLYAFHFTSAVMLWEELQGLVGGALDGIETGI